MSKSTAFRDHVDALAERFGSYRKLAQASGMTLSAFSRGVKHEGTLSTENCLRLADATGESPDHILRLAGKGPIADVIQRVYGPPAVSRSSASDREFAALDPKLKAYLLGVLRTLAATPRP